eukprot:7127539-Alexandrium_andersonii.AAC.1
MGLCPSDWAAPLEHLADTCRPLGQVQCHCGSSRPTGASRSTTGGTWYAGARGPSRGGWILAVAFCR